MNWFQKKCVPILISGFFMCLFHTKAYNQTFLNFEKSGSGFSVGIKDNHFAFLSVDVAKYFTVLYKNSIYTESFKVQIFESQVYRKFFVENFTIIPEVRFGGKINTEFLYANISTETVYSINDNILLAFNPILLFVNNGFKMKFQAGSFVNLYQGNLYYLLQYGPSVIFTNDSNNLKTGVIFNENKLKLSSSIHIPENLDFKYSRIVLSFIYSFK